MSEGSVRLAREGTRASIVFDRPAARNAMTWKMYEQLEQHCRALAGDSGVRVVTFAGAGGEAFVAGTDIAQFLDFEGGEAGVAYERRVDEVIGSIEALPMPSLALVDGWAVGGGLAIATACDLRIATPRSRFGVPIAKTLGNTLSIANMARLQAAWGPQRLKRMLMLAEIVGAEEALSCGFLHRLCLADDFDAVAGSLCRDLSALAPVTQSVAKESLRRLAQAALPEGEDLIRRCYGSEDFAEGVRAFTERRPAVWKGR